MRKNRLAVHLALLCIALTVGWYLRGIFEGPAGGGSGTSQNAREKPAKGESPQKYSSPESVGYQNSRVSAYQPVGELQAELSVRGESAEATSAQEPPDSVAQQILGHKVESSLDGMILRAAHPQPENTHSQLPAGKVLPPDVRPEDLEVSPETGGAMRILRRVPEPPQAQSPSAAAPTENTDRVVASVPDKALLQNLQPVKKLPDYPPTSKPRRN